ncbi:flagellar hook-length control protein [Shewanella halifaxensis HAW-EB4]|uniref:Flagellar hook-length control protein n=1 Tax=Shewanella halifaxensis (strain HAW-EB4) TaxID=458817 RepID=B0TMF0_SHEHH|nr:flagellar hook-length control protein FliK [Shewanella halifaxensis]ABZ76019.1 flagellar hook-length control protein [Shewanella halifaxensis HAW-EB4]
MQQMNNILLSSPEPSKKATENHSKSVESSLEPSQKPKTNSEGDSFSAALEKVGKQTQDRANTQSAAKKALAGDENLAESTIKAETKDESATDDVSQVFAQINLANNFGSEAQLAANGESLPLATEPLEPGKLGDDLTASELPDEILMALSQQSGMSEQELSKLSAAELKNLLQQSQILDANGELKAEFAAMANGNLGLGDNQQSKEQGAALAGQAGVTDKAAQANIAMDPKVLQSELKGADAKNTNETRDIFGKELAGLTQSQSQSTSAEQLKAAKNAEGTSQTIANQLTATEQLKTAELSVRMMSSQTGQEANLAGVNTDAAQDLKAVIGLQSQALQLQSGANRQELPQFQFALKQAGEQTPPMQQMIQRFSPMMNQQLITMVSNGVQHAEIRLDPPELGHMMVRIQVQGDTTQVQFQVSQHQTRDLVEQAMPRLREMLAEQGMQLTDGQVSQGSGGNSDGEQGSGRGNDNGMAETDEISAEELLARSNLSTSSASGIDYYA